MLITVAETPEFTSQAKAEGMSRQDVEELISAVAANPTAGESLGAGLYKVRVARSGGGKSGGFRVVTLFVTMDHPVLLLAVLSKSKAPNFSDKKMKEMKKKKKEAKSKRKSK